MADRTITTPDRHPGVSTRTRREAFTALGVTGLAAIAVGGFARPDNLIGADQIGAPAHKIGSDAAILAACAAFKAAHLAQNHFDATADETDIGTEEYERQVDAVCANWFEKLQAVLDAPVPTTPAGVAALAHAARVALMDQNSDPEQRTREERLAMYALGIVAEA